MLFYSYFVQKIGESNVCTYPCHPGHPKGISADHHPLTKYSFAHIAVSHRVKGQANDQPAKYSFYSLKFASKKYENYSNKILTSRCRPSPLWSKKLLIITVKSWSHRLEYIFILTSQFILSNDMIMFYFSIFNNQILD